MLLECGSLLPLSPALRDSLLAEHWSAVLGRVRREQARSRKAAASCRTPERLRRMPVLFLRQHLRQVHRLEWQSLAVNHPCKVHQASRVIGYKVLGVCLGGKLEFVLAHGD